MDETQETVETKVVDEEDTQQENSEVNSDSVTTENQEEKSYENLLEMYKESVELIKQMKTMLNDQFQSSDKKPGIEGEIESYLDSEESLTGRLLNKYKKE
jgi:hypothetical protein|nr:MAG TPA: hypothetical protein [Caudoviricetes sp.]